ncbi:hypothetical protein SCLARK_00980 [Spiroplasma clarkii]|uniref:hypothetical protein n=1 Tax=Spiroplasma clarkii TaxID=2139 RepID=UPI000B563EF7|nr:hypothetical protein [Spiroplasma clarkii]ARU91575.1 hypothetical protein SCLARK_00980 [Spiroplasma clarkii]
MFWDEIANDSPATENDLMRTTDLDEPEVVETMFKLKNSKTVSTKTVQLNSEVTDLESKTVDFDEVLKRNEAKYNNANSLIDDNLAEQYSKTIDFNKGIDDEEIDNSEDFEINSDENFETKTFSSENNFNNDEKNDTEIVQKINSIFDEVSTKKTKTINFENDNLKETQTITKTLDLDKLDTDTDFENITQTNLFSKQKYSELLLTVLNNDNIEKIDDYVYKLDDYKMFLKNLNICLLLIQKKLNSVQQMLMTKLLMKQSLKYRKLILKS